MREKRVHTRNVVRLAGCLLSVTCVSAIAVSSAAAALPEVGRCVAVEKVTEGKKASYHGAYTDRKCMKPSPGKTGKYEWESGPGATKTFTAEAANEPAFETVKGATVTCQSGQFKGAEYTGAKTEKFSGGLALDDCITAEGKVCTTDPEHAGVIEDPLPIEGELGVVSGGADPTVGWDLKDLVFAFTCGEELKTGELGEAETIEGSVIGVVVKKSGSDLNRMSGTTRVQFEQQDGKQLPEAFEGGAKDTLSTTIVHGAGSSAQEQTGLSGTELNDYTESLEIRTEE